jgi:predicted Zn-dependent protease
MSRMTRVAALSCLVLVLALQVYLFGQAGEDPAIGKAFALVHAGKLNEAEIVLRAAAAADPKSEAVHATLGQLLFKQQKYEDAVQELGLALQINPASRENSLLLSEALIGWRHFDVAVNFLQAVQAKFGSYPEFHYDLGLAYYNGNKIKEAKTEFQEAARLEPSLDRAQFLLAACIATEGDYANAVEIFRKLAKDHPTNATYWATLAQMLTHLGIENLPEALRACRRARTLKPRDPRVQYITATVLMQSGDFAEARPLLEHLVRLNPKNLAAHIALARIYGRLGKPELARKETQTVNQLEKEKASQNIPAVPGGPGASQEPPIPRPVPGRN